MGRKFGFSFSPKRALGISGAKSRIARATGIPTTRSGRQRKIGRMLTGSSRGSGCCVALLALGAWCAVGCLALAFGQSPSIPIATGTPTSRPTSSQPSTAKTSASTYTYLGKPRSEEWFERAYTRFSGDFIMLQGELQVLSQRVREGREINPSLAEAGRLGYAPLSEVLQVLDPSSVLLVSSSGLAGQSMVWHLKNIDTSVLVNGSLLGGKLLICAGTYEYSAVSGAKQKVASYEPVPRPTREEFAEALSKGLQLTEPRRIQRSVNGKRWVETKQVLVP